MNQTNLILPTFRRMILSSIKELSTSSISNMVQKAKIKNYVIKKFNLPDSRKTKENFQNSFNNLLKKQRIVEVPWESITYYSLVPTAKSPSINKLPSILRRRSLKLSKKSRKRTAKRTLSKVSTSDLKSCDLSDSSVVGFNRREKRHNISNIFIPNNYDNKVYINLYAEAARNFYR